MYILLHILFHYGLSQDIDYSSLCYTVGPCCLTYQISLNLFPSTAETITKGPRHDNMLTSSGVRLAFKFWAGGVMWALKVPSLGWASWLRMAIITCPAECVPTSFPVLSSSPSTSSSCGLGKAKAAQHLAKRLTVRAVPPSSSTIPCAPESLLLERIICLHLSHPLYAPDVLSLILLKRIVCQDAAQIPSTKPPSTPAGSSSILSCILYPLPVERLPHLIITIWRWATGIFIVVPSPFPVPQSRWHMKVCWTSKWTLKKEKDYSQ